MVDAVIGFGEHCKRYRSARGLFLADQAEELKLSVSLISAIELNKRAIPEGYPERVAIWLGLNIQQREELLLSAATVNNVIKFRPKSTATAKFAFQLSRRLNELSHSELEKMRELLDRGEKTYE